MKKLVSCFLLTLALAIAAEPTPLDQSIGALHFEKAPLTAALRTLGRATRTTIHAEPNLAAEVTVDFAGGTLRDALTAVVEPSGFFFEAAPAGIVVRARKTVLYAIDYPQLTRSGSGSASITLGGATGGNGNTLGRQPHTASAPNARQRQHCLRRHTGLHLAGESKHVLDKPRSRAARDAQGRRCARAKPLQRRRANHCARETP